MPILKEYRLTKDGLKELEAELEALKTQRPEITDKIKTARELGDLSENDEYASARDEQARVEGRIIEIEHILQNYELIKDSKSSTIKLGHTVELVSDSKKTMTYSIVGSLEADPAERKISDASPIGQALIGKKVGDKVEINLPAGTTIYKIKAIK